MMTKTLMMVSFLTLAACNQEPTWLLVELDSENPAVRQDAVVTAGGIDHILVTQKLELMLADTDQSTRIAVVDALALHHSPTSVEPLVAMLSDSSTVVVSKSIDTLGQLKDPAALEPLMTILQADSAAPPLNAIWAIGQLGDVNAIPVLSQLRNHPDKWVRHSATEALRNLK